MSEPVTELDGGGKYSGPCKDGQPHGNGSCIWPDGSTYKGEWRSGKMHGKGRRVFLIFELHPKPTAFMFEFSAEVCDLDCFGLPLHRGL